MLAKKEDAARFGLAAVEFAVILPLLMTIVLGCVDFGRFAYSYIALTNAARAGAAYAIMNPYLLADQAPWMARIQQTAQDEMYQQTGYVAASLTIQTTAFTDANGLQRVQITAGYPFQMIVPWPGIPNNVMLQTAVQMRAIR
jgi:Flp pilus assembly protein TadG